MKCDVFKRRERARYWYIERRECVVFKICFSAQTRMNNTSYRWLMCHANWQSKRARLFLRPTSWLRKEKLAWKGNLQLQTLSDCSRWIYRASSYTPRAPGCPQHGKNLLANVINRAPVGQAPSAPYTFCQQRLPHTLRSSSVHIGVVRFALNWKNVQSPTCPLNGSFQSSNCPLKGFFHSPNGIF